MELISSAQARAARSMLKWLQEDLEKSSGVSSTTIRSFENGTGISSRSIIKLRVTFEQSGIEFGEDDGVKWRNNVCVVHKGPDSCDKLFDDIATTVRKYGNDILCVFSSQEILTDFCGLPQRNNLERLEIVHEIADVKCIITDTQPSADFAASFEFIKISQNPVDGPHSYFIYGNKHAVIIRVSLAKFIVVIYDLELCAVSYRKHFQYLWDVSSLNDMVFSKKNRTR